MDTSKQFEKQQEAKHLQSRISLFINDFQIGTMLNLSGIRKLRGASPLALFMAIFLLPFEGNNFFQGIVKNKALPFKKDAAYDLLKNPCHNWRKFMRVACCKIKHVFLNTIEKTNLTQTGHLPARHGRIHSRRRKAGRLSIPAKH